MSNQVKERSKTVSLERHQRACSICLHEQRREIERAFIGWQSPIAIATAYALSDRATVYRHAHAFGLFERRQRNIRAALEKIIERAGEVDVTAAAVVSAIQAYTKINASGEWVDRTETVSLHEMFDRMSSEELKTYAETGALPAWFGQSAGATAEDALEEEEL